MQFLFKGHLYMGHLVKISYQAVVNLIGSSPKLTWPLIKRYYYQFTWRYNYLCSLYPPAAVIIPPLLFVVTSHAAQSD